MIVLKWVIVTFVFGVVLCGLFDAGCRQAIFLDTVGGLLVGLAHGVLHIACILDRMGTITPRRAAKVVAHHVRVCTVAGLLIGVGNAVLEMCGK
jgi:uncharacterized membrane protein required for colicin V production